MIRSWTNGTMVCNIIPWALVTIWKYPLGHLFHVNVPHPHTFLFTIHLRVFTNNYSSLPSSSCSHYLLSHILAVTFSHFSNRYHYLQSFSHSYGRIIGLPPSAPEFEFSHSHALTFSRSHVLTDCLTVVVCLHSPMVYIVVAFSGPLDYLCIFSIDELNVLYVHQWVD